MTKSDGEEGGQLEEWSVTPLNPLNWSNARKWTITITSCYMSSLISIASTAYSLGEDQMVVDLGVSKLLVTAGISFFTIAVALFPLVLAPLGEAIGRRYVYLASYSIFFIFCLPIALARNIQTVFVARFICGAAGSVGATMVGGTLSDIWTQDERGLPMAMFALSALFGTSIGPVFFSWTGTHASWRWIHWVMLIAFLPSAVLVLFVFNKETLPITIRRREGYEPPSPASSKPIMHRIRQALGISAVRPLVFLFSEPIATALCLWISFAWACLYLFLESIPLVFEPYGFTSAHNTRGVAFTGLAVGSLIGFSIYAVWERRWPVSGKVPEQRLPQSFFGGVLFTVGFFIYAWAARPGEVPWIVPQIGTAVIMTGLFLFYICIFNYLSDCYGTYTSSAIAAQSFSRNIFATAFPLFATQMYEGLTYPWASSLLGFLAALLAFVPLVLIRYGRCLRQRSPFASQNFDF